MTHTHTHKFIVWALYDDAKSSYKNAIKHYFNGLFEVHSIGINNIKFNEKKLYFYHLIDLSLCNENLIKELKDLPHPDIILSSPPCESWSSADCAGKMINSIKENGNWIVRNSKYYDDYLKKCHPVKRRYFIQKEKSRILGEATIGGTIQIINYFKPKVWIIENPQTSKIWDYQKYHWNFLGYENLTFYSSYNQNFSPKPTIFKSNIKLNLKNKKMIGNKEHMLKSDYSNRSAIPYELIKDIINQVLIKMKNE